MPHQRRKIRNAIVSLLKQGAFDSDGDQTFPPLDVGGRIYAQRTEASFESEDPICYVYHPTERTREVNAARTVYDRQLDVNVEIEYTNREGIDDELDRLAFQVEVLLLGEPTLDNLTNWIELTGTAISANESDGEQRRGTMRLSFIVDYNADVLTPGPYAVREFLSFGKQIETTDEAVSEIDQTIREA